jgi:DNA-binding NarL/FixJ family response regulator
MRMATSMPAGVLRVVLAHRDPVARAALREALHDGAGVAVVGEAATDEELVALLTHLRPDVVVLDVRLPGTGCVVATRHAKVTGGAAVLLLSGDEPDPRVLAALRAGAAGVMRTDSEPSDLVRALTLVGRGRPLRALRGPRGSRSPEEPVREARVIEIRRGSAHSPPIMSMGTTAASRGRHAGG